MVFGVAGSVAACGAAGRLVRQHARPDDHCAVFSLVGMAMFMFVGCEFVTPMAPRLRSARVIPAP